MKETDLPNPVPFLHRDISTQSQIGMLLQVAGMMLTAFAAARNAEDDDETFPREAKVASEVTFMKTCDRIDQILGDATRWSPDYQKSLERLYEEQHAERTKTFKAQRQAAELQYQVAKLQEKVSAELLTPHFKYKPALVKLEDGKFMAILGDPADAGSGIIGVGDSPKEAIASFDAYFDGEVPSPLQAWLHRRQLDIENGRETEPFPAKIYDKTLDPAGTGQTEEIEIVGQEPGANRDNPGPEQGLGNQQAQPGA